MNKKLFYSILFASVFINIIYIYNLVQEKKHKNEFYTLFKINNKSYAEGLISLKERLNSSNNKSKYHLIHIWDTFLIEPNKKIQYFSQLDSFFKYNPSKQVDCILMSVMRNESIRSFLNPRNIKFQNVRQLNDMDDYVSAICNKRKEKTKIRSVNLLINEQGDVLYYDDKIEYLLNRDTALLKILNSLK